MNCCVCFLRHLPHWLVINVNRTAPRARDPLHKLGARDEKHICDVSIGERRNGGLQNGLTSQNKLFSQWSCHYNMNGNDCPWEEQHILGGTPVYLSIGSPTTQQSVLLKETVSEVNLVSSPSEWLIKDLLVALWLPDNSKHAPLQTHGLGLIFLLSV